MSYQVLARKWRPKTFEELVGQEHVLGALVNALDQGRLHHAYLFTGTRGVGKTTIARILARALNCETGVTSKPCSGCAACEEITDGRFVDLIEVDAASRTKVEDTRDLLENVQYRPTRGRFKIYLIDEVHMLSNHSFNALLKTLEEPPEHVKFLLATTDPQKLPVTVLSRCLQFNLKNLPAQRISEYLETVLSQEQVPFESGALGHLARAAAGSMRDALSLTDQAISHGGGKLAENDVTEMLGTVDRKRIQDLVLAIQQKNGESLLAVSQELAEFSIDYLALVEEMLAFFHAVAVAQVVPGTEQHFTGNSDLVTKLAEQMAAEDVQLIYQMLLLGRKDLGIAPDLHMGFEMLMLRLLAFQPEAKSAFSNITVANTDSAPSEVPSAKKPEAAAQIESQMLAENTVASAVADRSRVEVELASQVQVASDELVSQAGVAAQPAKNFAEPSEDNHANSDAVQPNRVVDVQPDIDLSAESNAEQNPATTNTANGHFFNEHAPHSPETNARSEDQQRPAQKEVPKDLQSLNAANWVALYRDLSLEGMIGSVASHMVLENNEGGMVRLTLAEAGQSLFKSEHSERLADLLTSRFQEPVQVKVEMGESSLETPAQIAKREHREAIDAARDGMLTDPLMKEFMQEFQAELVPNSVDIIKH